MADDVTITIGAAIGGLIEGVSEANESLKELSETVKLLAAAFAIKEVTEFMNAMGELGEQAERTSKMLGVNTTSVQEMGLEAKLTGGTAESLTMMMERFQLSLQHAQNVTSQQAAALKALGISAKDFIGLSPDQQMLKLSDAVSKFADGGNKTAAVMALIGRQGAQMIPVLDQGRVGLELIRQTADQIAISPQNIESWSKLEHATVTLKAAITGLAGTLLGPFANAMSTSVSKMADMVGSMNAAAKAGTLWQRVMQSLTEGAMILADAESASTGHSVFDAMKPELAQQKIETLRETGIKLLTDLMGHANETGKTFEDMWNKLIGGGEVKKQVPALNLNVGAQQKDALKIADDAYKTAEQNINQLRDTYQISEEQKTEMLKAQLTIRANAEIQAGTNTKVAYAKMNADIAKLDTQATKEFFDAWKGVADTIANTFTSQLDSILSGTETFAEGMRKVFATMIEDMIALLVRLFTEWLTLDLISQAIGGGPIPFSAVLPKAFNIPGHAVGTPYVTNTGPAFLHEGEAVLTAEQNPFGPTGTGGSVLGGGANVTLNVSAIDAKSFQALLLENQGPLAMALKTMIRNNVGLLSQIGQGAR